MQHLGSAVQNNGFNLQASFLDRSARDIGLTGCIGTDVKCCNVRVAFVDFNHMEGDTHGF